jgi:hypothetical protein
MQNYNSSQIGVPYLRCDNVTIQYPVTGIPIVTISQARSIKLADGTVVQIEQANTISFELTIDNIIQIPLVDPTTGENLGMNMTSQMVMLGILGIIRQQQIIQNA